MRILIKGYYGFGNFGDDLLLFAVESFVRSNFPEAEIFIQSNFNENLDGFKQESGYQTYIDNIVSGPVEIIDWKYRGRFDLIVHGGGGVFFSAGSRGVLFLACRSLIERIGARRWAAFTGFARRLLGRERRIQATQSVAIGVGVGPFFGGLRRYLADTEELGSLSRLAVRDAKSSSEAAMLGLKEITSCYTDIAFSLKHRPDIQANSSRAIGFVLAQGKAMTQLASELVLRHDRSQYQIFCFDENTDTELIEQLRLQGHEPVVWHPTSQRVHDMLIALGGCDLVVSNRAHGVIAAALMGVPAIVIESDRKLLSIHKMLPRGSLLASPSELPELESKIRVAQSRLDELRTGLRADLKVQSCLADEMLGLALRA